MARLMTARIAMALAVFGGGLAAYKAAAQNGDIPALSAPPVVPYDSSTGSIAPAQAEKPAVGTKAPDRAAADTAQQDGAAADNKLPENAEGRFTFGRMSDGYVRLDNRTGQVSFCSKRTVGWTCQLAPEDRGVFENEITRLQEENATLKKELLTNGLALPGSMKNEVPMAQNDRPSFTMPSDEQIDRMKGMVGKAWRRLVDLISTLQKDVLKKS
jgi:hypothetical protein